MLVGIRMVGYHFQRFRYSSNPNGFQGISLNPKGTIPGQLFSIIFDIIL